MHQVGLHEIFFIMNIVIELFIYILVLFMRDKCFVKLNMNALTKI